MPLLTPDPPSQGAAGDILAAEIERDGPIPFSRFMEIALYHPAHGYYARQRDPFGREGDFYTAAQLQPVFGRLVASLLRTLRAEMDAGAEFTVVDWGAGRGEMREALAGFNYLALTDPAAPPPAPFHGAIFANELFDALPVDLAARRSGEWIEQRVARRAGAFAWTDGLPLSEEWREYAARLARPFDADSDLLLELPVQLDRVLTAMDAALASGALIAIDYGYTGAEIVRFPRGTLMSYRRHRALEEVLAQPGEQDITAHVPFDCLERMLAARGWRRVRFEKLAQTLLRAGEPDQFASALSAASEAESLKLRLQLKTLLFGMGESFRTLWMAKQDAHK
jgi:SAM-dependent MidA family methyltransferase